MALKWSCLLSSWIFYANGFWFYAVVPLQKGMGFSSALPRHCISCFLYFWQSSFVSRWICCLFADHYAYLVLCMASFVSWMLPVCVFIAPFVTALYRYSCKIVWPVIKLFYNIISFVQLSVEQNSSKLCVCSLGCRAVPRQSEKLSCRRPCCCGQSASEQTLFLE